jgi:cytidine deaminase
MSVQNFEELAQHQGHKVEVVVYGDRHNSAVECIECYEVLLDFDNSEDKNVATRN